MSPREPVRKAVLILSPLLGALLLWGLMILVLGTTQPFYVVKGNSMEPTLRDGDLVVVKKVEPSEVEPGDIIVFYKPGSKSEIIIHRVIQKAERRGEVYFRTKGDNNDSADPWLVPEEDLIGVVVGGSRPLKLPLLGRMASFIRSPPGLLLVALLYGLLAYQVLRGEG